jgi:hypothetical protein
MRETSDSLEATIGEHNEAAGKYRYSLFGTTDVYLVLTTDTNKNFVIKNDAYFTVCARPSSYAWGIDYEPDMEGSFAKTGTGELLELPNIDKTSLPVPEKQIDWSQVPNQELAKPTATPASGTFTESKKIELFSAEGGDIFYTISETGTPPADPTKESTPYNANTGITLSMSGLVQGGTDRVYTIKAIAGKDNMKDSQVASWQYTMKAPGLRTSFTRTDNPPGYTFVDDGVDGDGGYVWWVSCGDDYADDGLNIAALQSARYTKVILTVRFSARENGWDGYLRSRVYSGHVQRNPAREGAPSGNYWKQQDFEPEGWAEFQYEAEVPLSDFNTQFSIWYGAHGSSYDEFDVDWTTVTITAVK